MGNFDSRYTIFRERCEQVELSNEQQTVAFSIMPTGPARDFYYTLINGKCTSLNQYVSEILKRFEANEKTRFLTKILLFGSKRNNGNT